MFGNLLSPVLLTSGPPRGREVIRSEFVFCCLQPVAVVTERKISPVLKGSSVRGGLSVCVRACVVASLIPKPHFILFSQFSFSPSLNLDR